MYLWLLVFQYLLGVGLCCSVLLAAVMLLPGFCVRGAATSFGADTRTSIAAVLVVCYLALFGDGYTMLD